MIDIGQKVRFVPSFSKGENDSPERTREKEITGKVIYVDRAHKKFTVKFSCGGTTQFETFKPSQVGTDIHVVGGR